MAPAQMLLIDNPMYLSGTCALSPLFFALSVLPCSPKRVRSNAVRALPFMRLIRMVAGLNLRQRINYLVACLYPSFRTFPIIVLL